MKRIRRLGLIVGVLLACGVARGQQVATVQQAVDYVNNSWVTGVWFAEPTELLDHSPYYRTSNEDWGWVHNLTSVMPADALGIESATLTIIAWNVDPNTVEADHVVYMMPDRPPEGTNINGQDSAKHIFQLGVLNSYADAPVTVPWPSLPGQRSYWQTFWSVTAFELPPAVLDDLWVYGQAYVHLNIDQYMPAGWRVTLKSSTLTVRYLVSGTVTPPGVCVYRFWSPVLSSHFYTIDEAERDKLINEYPGVWIYEDVAYRALTDQTNPNAVAVWRFWSGVLNSHFYTIDETERDKLINEFPDVWTFEGPAFYAFPEGLQPVDTYPVYRFWSDTLSHHFYTMDEAEKQKLIDTYSAVWTYEGIAWYAYPPDQP
jgi:hypothetical protein